MVRTFEKYRFIPVFGWFLRLKIFISDPTYISAKEQRRLDRQELRAMLKTEMVLEDKNKIDPVPVYEDEPE